VRALAAIGDLVPLLLLPEIFGGTTAEENVVHVPPFVSGLKDQFDRDVLGPLINDGKITRYRAEPEYSGKSFVPVAIRITASDPAHVTYDLTIWGEALNRNSPPTNSDD
jgi:hypothetical protein